MQVHKSKNSDTHTQKKTADMANMYFLLAGHFTFNHSGGKIYTSHKWVWLYHMSSVQNHCDIPSPSTCHAWPEKRRPCPAMTFHYLPVVKKTDFLCAKENTMTALSMTVAISYASIHRVTIQIFVQPPSLHRRPVHISTCSCIIFGFLCNFVVCTQQGIPVKIFGSDSTAVQLQYAPQQAIMLPSSKRAPASQIFLLQQADLPQCRCMFPFLISSMNGSIERGEMQHQNLEENIARFRTELMALQWAGPDG